MNERTPAVNENPFAPPRASLDPVPVGSSEGAVLASRWERLGGALVDSLLSSVVAIPAAMTVGVAGISQANQNPFSLYLAAGAMGIVSFVLFAALLIVQWTFLTKRGQSLGKMVAGTRIVRLDGSPPGFTRAVALRNWPVLALGWLPQPWSLLAILDILTIFGSERRCLHDYVAGTKVIKAPRR